MKYEEYQALLDRIDRARAWEAGDQRGALRYLTAAATARAAAAVRTGQVVSCVRRSGPPPGLPDSLVISTSTEAAQDWVAVNETITFAQHGPSSMTHMDALGHFIFDGRAHSGDGLEILTPSGLRSQDITSASGGIVTRGLLLDLPRIAGPRVEPDQLVPLSAVQDWLARHETRLESGDILFVKTGRDDATRYDERGYPEVGGLDVDCLEWVHEGQCSVIVSDAGMDTVTSPIDGVALPWHVSTLTRMGVRLVDNADLVALAEAAAAHDRITFMAVLAPLHLPGASASPVNPLAVF